jgi:inner membrane protein
MHPATHFLLSWLSANSANSLRQSTARRERGFIAFAGIAPDIDGFGAPFEMLTRGTDNELHWYADYHHILAHNGLFCLGLATFAAALSRSSLRLRVFWLVLLTSHLHLVCDVLGSRGPDGSDWPIPYLLPFSNAWQLTWSGQWLLNGWQNILITLIALAMTFELARRHGFSPLELVNKDLDEGFVETLRQRFGGPVKPSEQQPEVEGGSQKSL